jgi:surface polysaccharide O-acyltransferase-like enzyme
MYRFVKFAYYNDITMTRKSNFELLRIISIIFVITLHVNGAAFQTFEKFTPTWIISLLIESFAICGVSVFVILSGYFLSAKKGSKISKTNQLLKYSTIIFILLTLFNTLVDQSNPWQAIIKNLKNYATNGWWYLWIIVPIYMLSPYFNQLINLLNQKELRNMILILFVYFYLNPTIYYYVNALALPLFNGFNPIFNLSPNTGSTFINFFILYFVGGYLRRYHLTKSRLLSLAVFLACGIINALVIIVTYIYNRNLILLMTYDNILIPIQAIALFNLIRLTPIKYSRLINLIASTTLGIYLIHTQVILKLIDPLNINTVYSSPLTYIWKIALIISTTYTISMFIILFGNFFIHRFNGDLQARSN